MSSDCYVLTLTELAEINPKRVIRKGTVAPFIEMAALPALSRDIHEGKIVEKEFTGGGARFTNGDTLLARITPCLENGKTALVSCLPSNTNGHGSTEFIVLTPKLVTDRNFLYYLVRSDDFRTYAISRMEGTSGRQRVPNDAISQYSFLCLPDDEREEVGNLLSILDDRITLLRETNATLEAIAQALFKSWFIDFDPVHAKQQGLAPEGMDEATAALFPDSFEESELGLVPKGWRVVAVEDLCSVITNGGTPSRSNKKFWEGGTIPWFKTGDFSDGFLLSPVERITDDALKGSSAKLLPADSILMAIYAAPTVGRLGVLTEPATFNQACTGMVAKGEVGTWFLYWTLYSARDWFNNRANGAAQQNISKAIVASCKVTIPTEQVLMAFNQVAEALHIRIRANSQQAQTLATLRDTLLPRLISGQLRLPEAEAS